MTSTPKSFLILLMLCLGMGALSGCQDSRLNGSSQTEVKSSLDRYLTESSKIRIYYRSPSLTLTPITDLTLTINDARLPSTIYNGAYGDRRDPSVPQDLNLLMKVYTKDVPSGDFYFETFILADVYEVSNVTTVLSWMLQYGFNRTDFKLSKNKWNALHKGIEVVCIQCRDKTSSEVLSDVLTNQLFLNGMLATVRAENPGLDLHWVGYRNPSPLVAFSSPSVGSDFSANLTATENDLVHLQMVLVDPLNSTVKLGPTQWTHHFNGTDLISQSGENFFHLQFPYEVAGNNVVYADVLGGSGGDQRYTFRFNVANSDRAPVWSSGVSLSFSGNHKSDVNLNSYCSDPDPGTVLSYELQEGPAGLVVTPEGTLSWNPAQPLSGPNQLGSFDVKILCIDDDVERKSSVGTLQLQVSPDHLPEFVVMPSSWSLNEGSLGTLTVEAADADGDPLELLVSNKSGIKSGLPINSAVFSIVKTATTTTTSTFEITFMPSYLQMIGNNGTVTISLAVRYESSAGALDTANSTRTVDLNLNITNVDDPPVWTVPPMDQTVTENIAFAGLSGGTAMDPAPNSSALTYFLSYSSVDCDWSLTVHPSTGVISGTPGFNSARECSFRLTARDGTGLTTESSTFIYLVENTNRPLVQSYVDPFEYFVEGVSFTTAVPLGGYPTLTVDERKSLRFSLKNLFQDEDVSSGDEYEWINYECLNCAALGITNFYFSSSTHEVYWTPDSVAAAGSPYLFQIKATDIGGSSATAEVEVVVIDGPSPLTLSTSVSSGQIIVDENIPPAGATTYFSITVAPAPSGNPVDEYEYRFLQISCQKVGGGTCRSGFFNPPFAVNGHGSQGPTDFIFSVIPNATDGDAGYPNTEVHYTLYFLVAKADDLSLFQEMTLTLTVRNMNQAPTSVGVGNLNSTGGPYLYGTSTYAVTAIDANSDVKVGSAWKKTYKLEFDLQDADGANDSKSYQFLETTVPGSITDNAWNFKLPGCLSKGSGQITRYYNVEGGDGRGQTISRQVQLTIRNIQTPVHPSCM